MKLYKKTAYGVHVKDIIQSMYIDQHSYNEDLDFWCAQGWTENYPQVDETEFCKCGYPMPCAKNVPVTFCKSLGDDNDS